MAFVLLLTLLPVSVLVNCSTIPEFCLTFAALFIFWQIFWWHHRRGLSQKEVKDFFWQPNLLNTSFSFLNSRGQYNKQCYWHIYWIDRNRAYALPLQLEVWIMRLIMAGRKTSRQLISLLFSHLNIMKRLIFILMGELANILLTNTCFIIDFKAFCIPGDSCVNRKSLILRLLFWYTYFIRIWKDTFWEYFICRQSHHLSNLNNVELLNSFSLLRFWPPYHRTIGHMNLAYSHREILDFYLQFKLYKLK